MTYYNFFFFYLQSLFATVKRTEKPSETTTSQFVKYLASSDTSHPGIRLGEKAFGALYEHMFLIQQDGLRASHHDDIPVDPNEVSVPDPLRPVCGPCVIRV